MDWNDLRFFLAVARTGSTLAAGNSLRVSQTTAARRVAALEKALGVTLFERRQQGYASTSAGEALLERAIAVEAAVEAFAAAAGAQGRDANGVVRLSTEELYAVTVLGPVLREFNEAFPAVHIELDTSEEMRDLGSGEADVALRSWKRPSGGGLVGRRIAADPWAFYCSRAYAKANGVPRTRRELRGHPLIGGGEKKVWQDYRAWLAREGFEDAVAMHHDTSTGLLSAVRAGIGVAVLPIFVADHEPDLVRCLPPAPDDDRELWLLTHERLRQEPRVRAVMDFLGEKLTRLGREADIGMITPE